MVGKGDCNPSCYKLGLRLQVVTNIGIPAAMLATSNLFLQGDIQPIVIVGHFLTTPKLSPDALMWNSTPERSSNAKAERLKLTLLARPLCKLSGQSENDAQCGND